MHQIIGSIIKVKPEFEERYVILHQYTFPEVLERIRKSNLRNYSIYLKDDLLFSYYEYHGNDLKSDMSVMAEDPHTQNWWKLTDPMQEPLPYRSPDEWWAQMKNIFHFQNDNFNGNYQRISLRVHSGPAPNPSAEELKDLINNSKQHFRLFSLFSIEDLHFLYCEIGTTINENDLISKMNLNPNVWVTSKEVFHTD